MIDRKANRTYTAEEKAEAVGLALAVGPLKAAEQLGIPPRTVASWMHKPGALGPPTAATRPEIIAKLQGTLNEAVDAVLLGLRDPKSRLSDRAHALDVLARHHALLTGGPTERTETSDTGAPALSWEESQQLAEWIARSLAARADPADIVQVLTTTPVDALPALPPGPIADDGGTPDA